MRQSRVVVGLDDLRLQLGVEPRFPSDIVASPNPLDGERGVGSLQVSYPLQLLSGSFAQEDVFPSVGPLRVSR